jgi:hypothetical protein
MVTPGQDVISLQIEYDSVMGVHPPPMTIACVGLAGALEVVPASGVVAAAPAV